MVFALVSKRGGVPAELEVYADKATAERALYVLESAGYCGKIYERPILTDDIPFVDFDFETSVGVSYPIENSEEVECDRIYNAYRLGRISEMVMSIKIQQVRDYFRLPPAPPTVCHVL